MAIDGKTGPRPGDISAGAIAAIEAQASATRERAGVALALAQAGRTAEAAALVAAAETLPCKRAEDAEALGFAAHELGDHILSRHFYARVTELAPGDALAWYNLASAERNLGALDAAETCCDRAVGLDGTLAQAALLRSQLRRQDIGHNHVDELSAMLARARTAGEALFLHYALAKEYDDLGAYDRAFAHFSQGAGLRRQNLRYDVGQDVAKLARIAAVFPHDAFTRQPSIERRGDHGFIFGLPRSGTTLAERILTGSELVRSNGETENLLGALMSGLGGGADIFEQVAAAAPTVVAMSYEARAGSAPRPGGLVLEKLPLNYLYAGAIAKTMPGAPMILLERHPVANCFAIYSTLFGNGYPFSYSLNDLAHYYHAYSRLIAHWKSCLGERLLAVPYEDLALDPRGHGHRIARFAGVAWQDEMVRIESNKTPSATASAVQIRKPIYTSAIDHWRHYERHLAPLVSELEALGVSLR